MGGSATGDDEASGGPAGEPEVPPGWCWDTSLRHDYRYWSGDSWTERVHDRAGFSTDPRLPNVPPKLSATEEPRGAPARYAVAYHAYPRSLVVDHQQVVLHTPPWAARLYLRPWWSFGWWVFSKDHARLSMAGRSLMIEDPTVDGHTLAVRGNRVSLRLGSKRDRIRSALERAGFELC